jgi:hypothetical protein
MERRNRQIREFLKEREVKKRMAKEREDDRRRIRDMEDKFKREMNRYTAKKLMEKFDTLNGCNRTTVSGCRTKFPTSLSKMFQEISKLFDGLSQMSNFFDRAGKVQNNTHGTRTYTS